MKLVNILLIAVYFEISFTYLYKFVLLYHRQILHYTRCYCIFLLLCMLHSLHRILKNVSYFNNSIISWTKPKNLTFAGCICVSKISCIAFISVTCWGCSTFTSLAVCIATHTSEWCSQEKICFAFIIITFPTESASGVTFMFFTLGMAFWKILNMIFLKLFQIFDSDLRTQVLLLLSYTYPSSHISLSHFPSPIFSHTLHCAPHAPHVSSLFLVKPALQYPVSHFPAPELSHLSQFDAQAEIKCVKIRIYLQE